MFSTNPASIFNTWVPLFAVAVLIVNRFNEWCDQALAQRLCQTHRPRHQGTRSFVGHVAANHRIRFCPHGIARAVEATQWPFRFIP